MCVCVCVCYVYIYIYIERERERDIHTHTHVYMYVYIYIYMQREIYRLLAGNKCYSEQTFLTRSDQTFPGRMKPGVRIIIYSIYSI